ncbi:hypothetical protein D3C75_1117810 [compost metagenome]
MAAKIAFESASSNKMSARLDTNDSLELSISGKRRIWALCIFLLTAASIAVPATIAIVIPGLSMSDTETGCILNFGLE